MALPQLWIPAHPHSRDLLVIAQALERVNQYVNLTLIPEEAVNKAQLVREVLIVGIEKADQGA